MRKAKHGRTRETETGRSLVSPANLVTPQASERCCLYSEVPGAALRNDTFWPSFMHTKEVFPLKGTHVVEAGSSGGVDMEVSPGHLELPILALSQTLHPET